MLSTTRASVRIARRSFATVVDNAGLKVASIESNQPTVSVTVLAKAGPRYQSKPGVAHALKNFAFKGTGERSALGTIRESELYGGVLSTTLTREHLALTAEFLRGDEQFFIDVLSSVISSTNYTRHEYEELVLPAMESDISALLADPASHAVELAHALAFRSGLGASLFAGPHSPVTAHDVQQFASSAFAKDNIAILGTGLSESSLKSLATSASSASGLTTSVSSYFGGETRVESHGGLQTIFIGFGSAGAPSSELAALAAYLDPNPSVKWARSESPLLQSGKTSARVVYLPYSDAALVGLLIQGSSTEQVTTAGKAAITALKGSTALKADDLKSAIAKAKFRLANTADTREGLINIVGSNVLSGSSGVSLESSLSSLDKITATAFNKAATTLIKGKPTFVAIGDTTKLPFADELGL
ncbi:Peptidase-M16 domain-containing protein [Mycena indigotica]|uniref:Cytochrome b-c1 complex subunit 2, mitochondrial n=1 Tax=Mycena indigotica TaxID=2126181 RepID=A0A8H6W8J0_9AGAR|nr:Peptidase-M16 domain-containing protein [Mycena indigotica]KAF7309704.1 Peptidase-M16 domain-containing protein [Mycena indigotica]